MNKAVEEQVVFGSFISNCYVLNIQGEIDDDYLSKLYNDIINTVTHHVDLKGIILDFSNICVFDTYIFESFKKMSKTISLMGIKVVWLGLKPGVVSALVDLNAEVDDICIAVNLQYGLKLIHSK